MRGRNLSAGTFLLGLAWGGRGVARGGRERGLGKGLGKMMNGSRSKEY